MTLTTGLAHYQLLLAASPTDGAGRLQAMRPVSPDAMRTELPAATTVRASERTVPPMAYKQWLKMLTGYEDSARPDGTR